VGKKRSFSQCYHHHQQAFKWWPLAVVTGCPRRTIGYVLYCKEKNCTHEDLRSSMNYFSRPTLLMNNGSEIYLSLHREVSPIGVFT
jgi:hypothetical protein